jgi:hypothetical protein
MSDQSSKYTYGNVKGPVLKKTNKIGGLVITQDEEDLDLR